MEDSLFAMGLKKVKKPVKKTAVKKPAGKKTAGKKPAGKKPAVKKPAVKKPAVKARGPITTALKTAEKIGSTAGTISKYTSWLGLGKASGSDVSKLKRELAVAKRNFLKNYRKTLDGTSGEKSQMVKKAREQMKKDDLKFLREHYEQQSMELLKTLGKI